jgi:hypothetical protein
MARSPIVSNDSKIALILVQAMFYGDKAAANDWGISRRTVDNYRRKLTTDAELVKLFNITRDEFCKNWLEDAPIAIRTAIKWITIKTLVEVQLTKDTFDVRLAEYYQQQSEQIGQMASESASPKTIEATAT